MTTKPVLPWFALAASGAIINLGDHEDAAAAYATLGDAVDDRDDYRLIGPEAAAAMASALSMWFEPVTGICLVHGDLSPLIYTAWVPFNATPAQIEEALYQARLNDDEEQERDGFMVQLVMRGDFDYGNNVILDLRG